METLYKYNDKPMYTKVCKITGYVIQQINGQRICGPPPEWPQSLPPPKHSEVFVGRIPRDCCEDDLIPIFAQIGRIYQFRLIMNFSGTNKGYAFVTYITKEDAIKAVKYLHDFPIYANHRLAVKKSLDNCKLFIGNLPSNITREEVLKEFSDKTEGVVDVIVYCKPVTDSGIHSNRCSYAFVQYSSHKMALMARRKLLPGNLKGRIELFGTKLTMDWAIPETNPDDDVMDKVKILFVRFLSSVATEDILKELFALREVFDLKVKRVKRIRNYAFVHFMSRSDAELALNYIQKFDLSSTPLAQCGHTIQVMWAKPPSVKPNVGAFDPRLGRAITFKMNSFDIKTSNEYDLSALKVL